MRENKADGLAQIHFGSVKAAGTVNCSQVDLRQYQGDIKVNVVGTNSSGVQSYCKVSFEESADASTWATASTLPTFTVFNAASGSIAQEGQIDTRATERWVRAVVGNATANVAVSVTGVAEKRYSP